MRQLFLLAAFLFAHLLGEVDADAHLIDHVDLGFEPVDVLLFVDEDLLEQLARAVVTLLDRDRDRCVEVRPLVQNAQRR